MKKFRFRAGLFVALLLGVPALAQQENDGCYCIGRDYLAYQLNHSNGKPQQTLTLLRLDSRQGVTERRHFEIEEFPVFGMRCLPEAIDLLAWDHIQRINLKNRGEPEFSTVEPQPEDSLLPDFSSDSLGNGATSSQTLSLPGADGRFTLVIEQQTTSEQGARRTVRSVLRYQTTAGTIREYPLFPDNHSTSTHE